MKDKKFRKFRQILAIIGIVLLVGMYIAAIIAAATDYEYSHAIFVTSIYCTFVIPVIIYIGQLLYKLAHKDRDAEDGK